MFDRIKRMLNNDLFWRRTVAASIDSILVLLLVLLIGLSSKFFGQLSVLLISFIFVHIVYHTISELFSPFKTSVGKYLLGLKVVSIKEDNQVQFALGPDSVLLRNVCKVAIFATFFIGYFIAGFRNNDQALHDQFSATKVVFN